MFKTIFFLFLLVNAGFCGPYTKNIYDQYITLPKTDLNCGELRRQFADGYIQLKEFIDRIRTCKEESNLSTQNEKSGFSKTKRGYTSLVFGYTNINPRQSFQYVSKHPDQLLSSQSNNIVQTDIRSPYISTRTSVTPAFNGNILKTFGFSSNTYATTQPQMRFLIPKTSNSYEVGYSTDPKTASSYQNGYFGDSLRYNDGGRQSYSYLRNAVDGKYPTTAYSNANQYSKMATFLQNYAMPNSYIYGTTSPSARKSQISDNNAPSYSSSLMLNNEYNVIRNKLLPTAIGNNLNQISKQKTATDFSKYSPKNYLTNSFFDHEIEQHSNIPKVSDSESPLKTLMTKQLREIDLELKDDVSMLSENSKNVIKKLSLKDYESLAPKIIESIAARSKIDLRKKLNSRLFTIKKSNLTNSFVLKPASNTSSSMVKDILDIKYSQLEDKLLNDIRRRQAVLQKLEQEALAEKYRHKSKPTAIPVGRLNEVFKSMNDEQISQKIFQNESETSNILADDYPQDNMGFFQDSKIPTKKRSLVSSNEKKNNYPYSNESSDSSKRNRVFYVNQNSQTSKESINSIDDKLLQNNILNDEPNLKGYVNIGPITPDGLLNIENIEGAENELSSNKMKSYIHPRYFPTLALRSANTQEVPNNVLEQYIPDPIYQGTDDKIQNMLLNANTKDVVNNILLVPNLQKPNLKSPIIEESNFVLPSTNALDNHKSIGSSAKEEKSTFTRSALFQNEFYKDIVRRAMKRNIHQFTMENDLKKSEKKSSIYHIEERTKRMFRLSDLDFGLNNGNRLE